MFLALSRGYKCQFVISILKIFASFVYSNLFHDLERSSTAMTAIGVNLDKLTSEMIIKIPQMSSHDSLMSKKSLDIACVLNPISSILQGKFAGSIYQAQS